MVWQMLLLLLFQPCFVLLADHSALIVLPIAFLIELVVVVPVKNRLDFLVKKLRLRDVARVGRAPSFRSFAKVVGDCLWVIGQRSEVDGGVVSHSEELLSPLLLSPLDPWTPDSFRNTWSLEIKPIVIPAVRPL